LDQRNDNQYVANISPSTQLVAGEDMYENHSRRDQHPKMRQEGERVPAHANPGNHALSFNDVSEICVRFARVWASTAFRSGPATRISVQYSRRA
jgi:hypothetical protein